MDDQINSDEIAYILSRYLDRTSTTFLLQNERELFKKIQKDASKYPTDLQTIKTFQESLSYYRRMKARQRLKGRKRYAGFRHYTSFSPGAMIAGKHKKKGKRPNKTKGKVRVRRVITRHMANGGL